MKALWIISALCAAAALSISIAAWSISQDRIAAPKDAGAPPVAIVSPKLFPQISGWAWVSDKQWIYLAANADRCEAVSLTRTLRSFAPMLRLWVPLGLDARPDEIAQLRCWRTGVGPALTPWAP